MKWRTGSADASLAILDSIKVVFVGILDMQWSMTSHGCFLAAESPGIVAQHLAQRNISLSQEMQQFSFYGRVCAMKGLLQALPEDLLCAQLQQLSRTPVSDTHSDPTPASLLQQGALSSRQGDHGSSGAQHMGSTSGQVQEQGSSEAQQNGSARASSNRQAASHPWLLLSDGALPACCAAVQQSTDAHHKFHAVSALAFCLDRIKQCLQVRPGFGLETRVVTANSLVRFTLMLYAPFS